MIVGIVTVAWLLFVGMFLFIWARHHARTRWLDGIHEARYVEGFDDRSLQGAA